MVTPKGIHGTRATHLGLSIASVGVLLRFAQDFQLVQVLLEVAFQSGPLPKRGPSDASQDKLHSSTRYVLKETSTTTRRVSLSQQRMHMGVTTAIICATHTLTHRHRKVGPIRPCLSSSEIAYERCFDVQCGGFLYLVLMFQKPESNAHNGAQSECCTSSHRPHARHPTWPTRVEYVLLQTAGV
jgi:hypothetical protein